MINYQHKTNKKINTLLMTVGFLFFIFIAAVPKAEAATSTVRGFGWLGDIYQNVYFNCLDDVAGDRLDREGNFNGFLDPPGFRFYVNPCQAGMQHAVEISDNGNFSGQAWNPTLGFISFSGTQAPPDGYGSTSSNCPTKCNASNYCWACYKESDQRVYGWARIDKSGEWLRLDSGLEPAPVSLQSCDLTNFVFPGHDIPSGEFVGYAASDPGNVDFTGTLSFNCESELGGSACATNNYKVYISNLTLGKLTAPNWSYEQACSNALGATLRWCKKSGTQTAYEVMVSTSPTPDPDMAVCRSGIKNSDYAMLQYNFPSSDCPGALEYGKNYYWWVRAYDENNVATDWYQYNTNSATSSDGNPDGISGPDFREDNALTFTTFKHKFPSPYFSWSPYEPTVGTSTFFTAVASKYYLTGNPTLAQSCDGSNCFYSWDVSNVTHTISSSTTATTTIVFTNSVKGAIINLELRDADSYMCSSSTAPMEINYALPLWREVKAK